MEYQEELVAKTVSTASFGEAPSDPFMEEQGTGGSEKAKTSLRIQYEAQSEVLRRQMGGLRGVQATLDLSARKICQLLMVDPSAWSRWLRDESQVPPHIWRALQWYFTIQDKMPGLNASYFLGRDTQNVEKSIELKWRDQEERLRSKLHLMELDQIKLKGLEQENARLNIRIHQIERKTAIWARSLLMTLLIAAFGFAAFFILGIK